LPRLTKALCLGIFGLLIALLLESGGYYRGVPTRAQISEAVELVRQRSSSDPEMNFFEVAVTLEKNKLVLRGKVGDVEQKMLLLAGFQQFPLPISDHVEIFPFKQISIPYGWVRTPWLDGRAQPNSEAALKTQFLFGTLLKILKTQGDWALVQSVSDRFIAWIPYPEVLPVAEPKFAELVGFDSVIVQNSQTTLFQDEALSQPAQTILAGSRLPLTLTTEQAYQVLVPTPEGIRPAFLAKKDQRLFIPGQPLVPQRLREEALRWLKIPYLVGGSTIKGWDDSAYIQHVYRQLGILLPRKSSQLLPLTLPIRDLEQLKAGDLFFYDQYVGLYLGDDEVLHPMPKQGSFMISSIHPGNPRYLKQLRTSFKQGARLLLGS
jgi:gamma-D-glutamyl-L-lysine dipeptidyl-peptidase